MGGDDLAASLGIGRGPTVGVADHEVGIHGQTGVGEHRLDHGQPPGQVGHEVVVHHVDVDPVRSARTVGTRDPIELISQMRDVAVEDGGVDSRHRVLLIVC